MTDINASGQKPGFLQRIFSRASEVVSSIPQQSVNGLNDTSSALEIIDAIKNNQIFKGNACPHDGKTITDAISIRYLGSGDSYSRYSQRNPEQVEIKLLLTMALRKARLLSPNEYQRVIELFSKNINDGQANDLLERAIGDLQEPIFGNRNNSSLIGVKTFPALFERMRANDEHSYQQANIGLNFDNITQVNILPELISKNPEYEVQRGDSLSEIAQTFDVDIADITRLNGLKNTNISIGQILKLPIRGYYEHTVQQGEVVSIIAEQYGVSSDKVAVINGLNDQREIRTNQVLIIPAE